MMKNKHYVNEIELQFQLLLSQGKGKVTPELLQMFINVAQRTILKMSYTNSLDREDCLQSGILRLIENYNKFDSDKYDKALPYITEVFKRAIAEHFNKLRQIKPQYFKTYNIKNPKFEPILKNGF